MPVPEAGATPHPADVPAADRAPEAGSARGTVRVAIDIGGTFVDAISFDAADGSVRAWKSPTTPSRPSDGVLEAISGLRYPFSEIETIVHGTTLGLNSILQRRGADVGLITTAGFEDILEIARAEVPTHEMYNFGYVPPPPLVARRFRLGAPERVDAEGEVLVPLDEAELLAAARRLVEEGGRDALAVCFLHSYANPAHEERAGELLRRAFPDVPVSLSVDVAREYREYERTTTTILDAFIRPVLEDYFGEIEGAMRAGGFAGSFHVMRSSGGAMTLELAREAPLMTVLSGPAGGIAGAAWLARGAGLDKLLSFDVGGTSADTCVIENGVPHHAYEARIDHLPLVLRVFDIRTIGAGGGSIAEADHGLLQVGPASAGAVPGPACYSTGGSDATVTDAAVVLGMIGSHEFLDGRMPLDEQAAHAAVAKVAANLGLDLLETAAGIIRVAVAKTVGSLREITTERGLDPREFALLAFGGAGPLLAPIVASEMDMPVTVVPPSPALFSAWGMLTTDLEYDVSRSVIVPLDSPEGLLRIREVLADLEVATTAALRQRGGDRSPPELHGEVEVRYQGQEFGLTVTVGADDTVATIGARFAELHERRHGHGIPEDMEVIACRVRGVMPVDKPVLARSEEASWGPSDGRPPEPLTARDLYDFATATVQHTSVYRRPSLPPGTFLPGPAIVTEGTSTTVVQSDQELVVDANLLLHVSRTRDPDGPMTRRNR